VLKPLGIWGVFGAAAIDGAFLGLPVDLIVGGYVAQNHSRFLLYVLMASAGSALGSLVVYAIGYAGGEELLRKRVSAERFERLHSAFDQHPFWSLMFPAMLPPPTPFKIFALGAAVAEMNITHFVVAIFLGRMIRFSILGIMIIEFGPEVVHVLNGFFVHHFGWVLIIGGAAVVVWILVRQRPKAQRP